MSILRSSAYQSEPKLIYSSVKAVEKKSGDEIERFEYGKKLSYQELEIFLAKTFENKLSYHLETLMETVAKNKKPHEQRKIKYQFSSDTNFSSIYNRTLLFLLEPMALVQVNHTKMMFTVDLLEGLTDIHFNKIDMPYFTIENLRIGLDGSIGTFLSDPSNETLGTDWSLRCFHHLKNKKFACIAHTGFGFDNNLSLRQKLLVCEKYYQMLGFTTMSSIGNIIPLKNVSDVEDGECCSICKEDFTKENLSDTVVIDCGHNFHIACIEEALRHRLECPYCRQAYK